MSDIEIGKFVGCNVNVDEIIKTHTDYPEGEDIGLIGKVKAYYEGDPNNLLIDCQSNHFVYHGLKFVASFLNLHYWSTGGNGPSLYFGLGNDGYIMLGTGSPVLSLYTASMASPLVVASSTSGSAQKANADYSYNSFKVITVWPQGAVNTALANAGKTQITEVGLIGRSIDAAGTVWYFNSGPNTLYQVNGAISLFCIVTASNGDFTAFTPDSNRSLIVEWEIGMSYI